MKILTIGSCFAVEIRRFLREKGFELLPPENERAMIYYNAANIMYEFERPDDLNDVFYKNSAGRFQNPFRRLAHYDSLEKAENETRRLNNLFKNCINEADVFIITLGMSEVFIAPNGYVMSNHPQYGLPKIRANIPADFHFVTPAENYSYIKRIAEVVAPKPVIFTVSPVPLQRTFRKMPFEEANKQSKESLRTAVEMLLFDKLPNVYYYDSYEYALSLNDIYKEDGRHVKDEIVEKIVNRFLNTIWKNVQL